MAAAPVDDPVFVTKGDLAYRRVRQLILSGELAPGTVLAQAALARTIGMSTTPLREGLRRLAQEGLVDLDAHRDARVRGLDAVEIRDLLEVRLALEPLAAGLAARRRTEEDLVALVDALEGLESLPDDPTPAQLETHHRFHAAVHRCSHNAPLVEVLDGVWVKSDRYRRHGLAEGRTDEEREARATEHRLLVEAIRDRDEQTAADLARRHAETSLAARSAFRLAGDDDADR